MFASLLPIFAASLAFVNAYPPPVGNPTGNPIVKPGLDELVPAGQPYTITWTPTTADTIALVLLRGPSNNVVPIATLADNIQNTGTFVWTPSTDLQPDTTGYGLQLICDDTGAYQYSTQFGISNPSYSGSNSSSSASGSASMSMTMSGSSNSTATMMSSYSASTGFTNSSSIVSPTKSMSIPSTLTSTATTGATTSKSSSSAAATASGAAGRMGYSVGGAVAALAVAVAAL